MPINHSPISDSDTLFSASCVEKAKFAGIVTAKASNLIYSVVVSGLFAAFSILGAEGVLGYQILYGSASFILNFPMAYLFGARAANFFICIRDAWRQSDWLFLFSAALSLGFAFATTFSGLQIAKDSANTFVEKESFFYSFFVGTFLFNTFSTRLMGSVDLIHGILKFFYLKLASDPLHVIRRQLESYGEKVNRHLLKNTASPEQLLLSYIQHFSADVTEMKRKESKANLSLCSVTALCSSAAELVSSLLFWEILISWIGITTLITFHTMPLWLYLIQKGINDFEFLAPLAHNSSFIVLSALSTHFFYMNSGIKFFSTINNFRKNSYCTLKESVSIRATAAYIAIVSAGFLIPACLSYFSGKGLEHKAALAMKTTFGDIAIKDWLALWPFALTESFVEYGWYDTVVGLAAGVIANGGAFVSATNVFLGYMMSYFNQQKSESPEYRYTDALAALDNPEIDKTKVSEYAARNIGSVSIFQRVGFFCSRVKNCISENTNEIIPCVGVTCC